MRSAVVDVLSVPVVVVVASVVMASVVVSDVLVVSAAVVLVVELVGVVPMQMYAFRFILSLMRAFRRYDS